MGYSYVFNPLAGAFDTVQDFQTVTAPDNAYIAPTGPVVFQDSFTEASNTLLNLHTPDVGTSWSLAQNTGGATYTVNTAGTLQPTTTLANVGCLYLANYASPSDAVEVGIRTNTVVSSSNTVGLVFRYVDSNNFYLVTLSSSQGNLILWKKVAGVWTFLTSAISPVIANTITKVRCVGSNIVVLVNDIPVIARVDTGVTGAGLCGISAGTIGQNATDDVSNTWRLANFYVQNYASSGGNNTTGINVTGDVAASGQIVGHAINSRLYPAFTFAGDTDTGIYRSASDNLTIVTGSGIRGTFNSSGLNVSGTLFTSNGSAAAPTHSFGADSNTGFYSVGGDILGISTGGALRWTVNSSGILARQPSASIPSVPNLDIATYGVVSNSGGSGNGFLLFNTSDYVNTFIQAQDFTGGAGMYSQGTLYFHAGIDYDAPTTPNVQFTISATNYDSVIGDFSVNINSVYGNNGGNIYLYAGYAYGGSGGNIDITAGGSDDNAGGYAQLNGGTGTSGGNTHINGGYGNLAVGGTLYLNGGGSGAGAGYGGTVSISGGDDGAGGYGPVVIQPANGGNIGVFGSSGSTQATTGVAAATVISGTGANIKEDDTFDGYTLAQVVYALRLYGWLA